MTKKILIVDDQIEVRELVSITLNVDGYETYQANSGKKAIEIAKAEKPELIIMDVMMPGGMTGVEATHIIKNDHETKDCTVIMLTAEGRKSDRELGLKAGASDYFIKPFSPLDLMRKVEEVLDN